MSCSNSKCNPCGPSEDAMNAIAERAAYYARIAQYAADQVGQFNTVYLGAKATAPTVDNSGNALIVGALYFNTTDDFIYIWDGTIWSGIFVGTNVVTTDTRQTITGEKVIQSLYESTSTTTLTLGTGSRTLTIGTGLNWVAGRQVRVKRTSSISYMSGTVTSYDSATGIMVFNATLNIGTGTFSDWTIFQDLGTAVPALRITANDSSSVFLVEDSTNPDTTPFTISASGRVGIGVTPDSTVCLSLDSTGVKFNDGSLLTSANNFGSENLTTTGIITSGDIAISSGITSTTVGVAGGASALPATPLGYISISINGSIRKIPYYNI